MREMDWNTLIWVIPIWMFIVLIGAIHRGEAWIEWFK